MGNLTKAVVFTVLALGLVCFAEPWTATLTLSDGSRALDLTFGRIDGASDLLGPEDDVLAIPPPSGPYAWFGIDDPENPYITMLYTDIRPDDGDSAMWIAHLYSFETTLTAHWNPAVLPAGDFFITASYPTGDIVEWFDMKAISELAFMHAMDIKIVHQPDGYYPPDVPVFANWYPYDGATGVSVRTEIRFDVTDPGSGINPESITMTVGGASVTDGLSLSPIENGYRVSYTPPEPLPGESWISVIVSAADNALEPNVVSEVISFRTGYSILPVLWEIPLVAFNIDSLDTSFVDLFLGADPMATAGFDMGYDIVFPMAPPSLFYAFFPLADADYPLFNMLTRDIRLSDLFFDEWIIRFGNFDDELGVRWSESDIPVGKEAFIAATFPGIYPLDGEWWNMRSIDELVFGPGRQVWIKVLSPSGDTIAPVVEYTNPSDDETGVAVSTDIRVGITDIGSGVDPTSIWLIVDGVDVTMSLIISNESGTTIARYIPPSDFPPLANIEVTIGASDLADPANTMEYNWNFVTGYFVTPEWMQSIIVWTDEPGEPLRHFTLHFGADSAGTDLFDYGLDQQQPPAPPGDTPYGYFQIVDPLWNQLSRDIRNSADFEIIWVAMMMRIPVDETIANWISWDPELLPEDGGFSFAWVNSPDTVWQNMRLVDRVDIETPGMLLIRFRRSAPPTFCLSGVVTTEDGNPAEGALVWISEALNAIADADGNYEICGIEMGVWEVLTTLEGFYPDLVSFDFEDDIVYNPVLSPIPPPTAIVRGNISCEDEGNPEGAIVVLGDDTTFASAEGIYQFNDVPYGDYDMFVSLEGYIPQAREIAVTEPDVEEDFLLVRQVGNIVGIIGLSDMPVNLSGTMVELVGTGIPAAYTNTDGHYLFSDVPLGVYDVRISRTDYITLDTTLAHFSAIDTLNATLEWVFVLPPPRNLSGRATYNNRIILDWDEPNPSTATLLGYNVYHQMAFSGDSLIGYVPQPYTEFVNWDLYNYLPYTYKVSAVYSEGESETTEPLTVWLNPDSTSSDILVWDFDNGAMLANQGSSDEAEFLRQRIELYADLNVDVTTQDENLGTRDLYAYRAIILITGVDDATDAVPNNSSINNLARYIAAGGRVFVEGADFGYDFGREASPPNRRNLFGLFGAKYVADGYMRTDGNVVSLLGENTAFFNEGVVNIGYDYRNSADQRIDEWDTTEVAEGTSWAMFSQSDPTPMVSNLRMLYREMNSWRTVLSSVYIGAMSDVRPPSTRQNVLAAILNFLLGTNYTIVEEVKDRLPENLALSASPNPFNAACRFSIEITEPANISLVVYDLTGRPVANLADCYTAPGFYSATWDGTSDSGDNLPSGIYFAVLNCHGKVAKTRVTLIK